MNPTCRLVLCLALLVQVAFIIAEDGSYAHEEAQPPPEEHPPPPEEHPPPPPPPPSPPTKPDRPHPLPLPPVLNLFAPQSICDFLTYIQQVNQAYINNQLRMLNQIWSAYG